MAIGQKVTVRIGTNGWLAEGRVVDVTAGEIQVAIKRRNPLAMPIVVWVAR